MRKSLHRSKFRALNCGDFDRKQLCNVNICRGLSEIAQNNKIFHRNRYILSWQACSHALSMLSPMVMVIKHFLHLRHNVGCQVLKRTVKIGAALVENAGCLNNKYQRGEKKKKANYRGSQKNDPRQSKRRLLNTCECSQAATSQCHERGATWRRETGRWDEKKKQGRKNRKAIQISHSHAWRELGVVMVTFAACQ